jgi:hypothetical protein
MIMAAIGNALTRDGVRRAFLGPDVEQSVRPLLAMETFSARL